ncbi:cationic peroxidase 1-like protein [Cinnamomum micranthum f. kanehirae]|uniref:Cationic peroxidase 1-like protein n=1 Tax=Cinnamomum micranthum f. kanehirae TaxID=337451 RepID=A0A443Q373_9MAGN|nr:cationic peroxidase 1-like protein [Cinnamomum micranthum f. kanehirae]
MIDMPTFNPSDLITYFANNSLTTKDLLALSESHTIGQAMCTSFRARIYNETMIDSSFATSLKSNCLESESPESLT